MGAFLYFGLVLATVMLVAPPLALFQLMLETLREREVPAVEEPVPPTWRSQRPESLMPPPSVRSLTCA